MEIRVIGSSSKGNCTWVSDGETQLLLDAGLPFKRIQLFLDFRVADLSAALITHSHKDHSRSVRQLLAAGVDCMMPCESIAEIGILNHLHGILPAPTAPDILDIGTWSITSLPVVHDVVNVAYLLRSSAGDKLLYVTDTSYVSYRFAGLTHILIECNWSKETLAPDLDPVVLRRLYRNHFNLRNVKRFLEANDLSAVREIHLLHLSAGNSDAALFQREIEQLTGKPTYIGEE